MQKKKHLHVEVNLDELPERVLEETANYEILVENYLSNRSTSGLEQCYIIRNKTSGVIEQRWGAYPDALQGIIVLQEGLDKLELEFARSQGKIQ